MIVTNIKNEYENIVGIQLSTEKVLSSILIEPDSRRAKESGEYSHFLQSKFGFDDVEQQVYESLYILVMFSEFNEAESLLELIESDVKGTLPFLLLNLVLKLKQDRAKDVQSLYSDLIKYSDSLPDGCENYYSLCVFLSNIYLYSKVKKKQEDALEYLTAINNTFYKDNPNILKSNNVAAYLAKAFYLYLLFDLIRDKKFVKSEKLKDLFLESFREVINDPGIDGQFVKSDILKYKLHYLHHSQYTLDIANHFVATPLTERLSKKIDEVAANYKHFGDQSAVVMEFDTLPFIQQVGDFERTRFPVEKISDRYLILKVLLELLKRELYVGSEVHLQFIIFIITNEYKKNKILGSCFGFERSQSSVHSTCLENDIKLLKNNNGLIRFKRDYYKKYLKLTDAGEDVVTLLEEHFLNSENNKKAAVIIDNIIDEISRNFKKVISNTESKVNVIPLYLLKERLINQRINSSKSSFFEYKLGEKIFRKDFIFSYDWDAFWPVRFVNYGATIIDNDIKYAFERIDKDNKEQDYAKLSIGKKSLKLRMGYLEPRLNMELPLDVANGSDNAKKHSITFEVSNSLKPYEQPFKSTIGLEEMLLNELEKRDQLSTIDNDYCPTSKSFGSLSRGYEMWNYTGIEKIRLNEKTFVKLLYSSCRICRLTGFCDKRKKEYNCNCEENTTEQEYDYVFLSIKPISMEEYNSSDLLKTDTIQPEVA